MKRILAALLIVFSASASVCAQQDTVNDTLRLPRLVVKASVAPLFSVFTPDMHADLGAELRIRKRFTLDFFGGIHSRSIFRNDHSNTRGFYGTVGFRRYFLKKNGLYLGASWTWGLREKSYTLEFQTNTPYSKRTRVTKWYQTFYPHVGWHGSVFSRKKYPIDACVGIAFENRDYEFTNLTATEITLLNDMEAIGMEDQPHRETRTYFAFWIKVGIVALR